MPLFRIDVSPLRQSPAFARLWVANLVTAVGSQATFVTLAYQLAHLTNSTVAVGVLGIVELLPLVVFGLLGGVIADAHDRRRIAIATEALAMVCAGVLLTNALLPHPAIWLLYVVSAIQVTAGSLQQPALDSIRQQVIPHDLQRQASTLASIRFNATAIIGPALGGLLAVSVGSSAVYALDVVTFLGSLALLVTLRVPTRVSVATTASMGALVDGLRFAVARRDLLGTYLVDIAAMVLAYPIVMLPFVAERFHEHGALALLYAALPVGAFIGGLTSGSWTEKVHHYGRAIVVAASTWGLGIALFGLASSLPIALAGLAVAGYADSLSAVFRGTMWNQSIPPAMRGRMAGVELLSYSVGPTGGQLRSGVLASWMPLGTSLAVGGFASTGVCAGLAGALPALWRFDVRTDPNVAQVAAIRAAEVEG